MPNKFGIKMLSTKAYQLFLETAWTLQQEAVQTQELGLQAIDIRAGLKGSK